jgi:uncharacterized protein (TIRG00374 family)
MAGGPVSLPKRTLARILGYGLAVVFLVWVFYDIHLERLWEHMKSIRWGWMTLGVVIDTAAYLLEGVRWHLLLRPLRSVSVGHTTQAIYAGAFLNEILPLRVGELARGYFLSRRIGADFFAVVPSMAVERLFEALWGTAAIGLTAIFVPLPANLIHAADILGAIVIALALLIGAFVIWSRKKDWEGGRRGSRLFAPLLSILKRLGAGFRNIGLSRSVYGAFALTLLIQACFAAAFWIIMRGYGLAFSFWVGVAVFFIVLLGTALPNAPANVGSYQFFCVLGLTLFGVDKTQAAGFSVVIFIILTVPLLILGAIALARTGMSLAAIKNRLRQLRSGPPGPSHAAREKS